MNRPKYQTVSVAGITLTASAQQAMYYMQEDTYKAVCENLDRIALRLCEEVDEATASENLDLVTSILKSRDLIYKIGETDE
jgi:hypothetical protein